MTVLFSPLVESACCEYHNFDGRQQPNRMLKLTRDKNQGDYLSVFVTCTLCHSYVMFLSVLFLGLWRVSKGTCPCNIWDCKNIKFGASSTARWKLPLAQPCRVNSMPILTATTLNLFILPIKFATAYRSTNHTTDTAFAFLAHPCSIRSIPSSPSPTTGTCTRSSFTMASGWRSRLKNFLLRRLEQLGRSLGFFCRQNRTT